MDGKPLINRLLSGIVILKLKGEYVYVRPAKVQDKAFADVYAQEIYEDALIDGILRNKDLEKLLIDKGWWSKEQEEEFDTLNKNLEQMKLDYYNHFWKKQTKDYIKAAIDKQKKKINKLFEEKFLFFDKSCEYLRDFAKGTILVERCSFLSDGSRATKKFGIMQLINSFIASNLSDEQIREVAKGYEWRALWGAKDAGLFESRICDLTHEQISLMSWSRFYDGIYESMDRPDDEVIQDNIALDGWTISENRKRKEEEKKERGEKLVSDSMGNPGELFVPVQNQQEQEEVLALNDAYGKSVIRSKAKQFQETGGEKEEDLRHVKKELQMEKLRQAKESRR